MIEISKPNIKQLSAYVEIIHDLLEALSMDDESPLTKEFITDELMDRHYLVRYLAEDLLEKAQNKSEVY